MLRLVFGVGSTCLLEEGEVGWVSLLLQVTIIAGIAVIAISWVRVRSVGWVAIWSIWSIVWSCVAIAVAIRWCDHGNADCSGDHAKEEKGDNLQFMFKDKLLVSSQKVSTLGYPYSGLHCGLVCWGFACLIWSWFESCGWFAVCWEHSFIYSSLVAW